jgi:hypothetical protein
MADVDGSAIGAVDTLASSGADTAGVYEIQQWGPDLVAVVFDQPMRVDSAMRSAASFAFVAESPPTATPVAVREVFVPYSARGSTDRVWLVVTAMDDGARYRVTCGASLLSSSGPSLHPLRNFGRVVAHQTKIEQMLLRHPFWSKTIGTTARGLMGAIARQMDDMHGARDDDLTP